MRSGYFPDIFLGLLLCGLGIGLAFVTATVGALAGVADRDAGLACGLSNTALQIGTALGVAIVTTVAVSRAGGYQAAHSTAAGSSRRPRATGPRSGPAPCSPRSAWRWRWRCRRQPRKAAGELPEPVPATSARD